jgi:hypothetical protein
MSAPITRRGALGWLVQGGLAMTALLFARTSATEAAPAPAVLDDLGDLDLPLDYELTDAQRRADLLHARLEATLTPGQYRLVKTLVDAESAAQYVEASADRDRLIEVTARHFGLLAPRVREVAYHVLDTEYGESVWCGLGDNAETVAEVRAALAEVGLVPGPTFDVSPCVVRAGGSAA